MRVFKQIQDLPFDKEVVLSMGNFDGVHLGHQYLLSHVKDLSRNSISAVLTFENHPLEVINPKMKPPLITTLDHKLALLEKVGVDTVILLRFTPEIAAMTYDLFLKRLKKTIPFTDLVLGQGSSFGHKKAGTQEAIEALSTSLEFKCHYLPPFYQEGAVVSSGRIRKSLASGNLEEARDLLGRSHSIYTQFEKEKNGYKADPIKLELQLPPSDTYNVFLPKMNLFSKLHIQSHLLSLDCSTLPEEPIEVVFS